MYAVTSPIMNDTVASLVVEDESVRQAAVRCCLSGNDPMSGRDVELRWDWVGWIAWLCVRERSPESCEEGGDLALCSEHRVWTLGES